MVSREILHLSVNKSLVVYKGIIWGKWVYSRRGRRRGRRALCSSESYPCLGEGLDDAVGCLWRSLRGIRMVGVRLVKFCREILEVLL